MSPHIHVVKHDLRFGIERMTTEVNIEAELFLGCFNQSTIRDYETLLNSVFMIVNRGLGDRLKASYDVNTKLEAIAALYYFRNPNLTSDTAATISTILSYVPKVEGWYALGGVNTPDFGEVTCDVTWKSPRKPVDEHYVARCLFPEFAENIAPLYIPARTRAEILKGMAKRLKPPPRETLIHNGKTWDLEATRRLLRCTSLFILDETKKRWSSVALLSPEEVIEECRKHANQRFQSKRQIDDYIEGARIAMQEDRESPLFRSCIDSAVDVGDFIKQEPYKKCAPVRFIMCPSEKVRGFCHALLMNAQRRLFGEGSTLNPWCVKHMSEEERKTAVINRFGCSPTCNTDYSSMEASITKYHMHDIERYYFTTLCAPNEEEKINALWNRYEKGPYRATGKDEVITFDPMRLSGQEHTSSGNFIVNTTWLFAIIYMITGEYPDIDRLRLLAEGDDGLFTAEIILQSGKVYHVDPQMFSLAAQALGAALKIDIYPRVDEASFCGIKLGPYLRAVTKEPGDHLVLDTYEVLSKILWDVSYDRSTGKHDLAKCFARCLSYLPRCVGNPELYEAVYYLALKSQPSEKFRQSAYYRNILIRTFYQGDFEMVPDPDMTLSKYCEKLKLPMPHLTCVPRVLTTKSDNPFNMEIREVLPQDYAFDVFYYVEVFARRLRAWKDTVEIKMSHDGFCGFYAIHQFLYRTGQVQEACGTRFISDRIENVAQHTSHPDTLLDGDGGFAMSDLPHYLHDGEYVVIEENGDVSRYECQQGIIIKTPAVRGNLWVRFHHYHGLMGTGGHAMLMEVKPEEEPVYYGLGRWFSVWILLLIVALILCTYGMFKTTFFGLPLFVYTIFFDNFLAAIWAYLPKTVTNKLNSATSTLVWPLASMYGWNVLPSMITWSFGGLVAYCVVWKTGILQRFLEHLENRSLTGLARTGSFIYRHGWAVRVLQALIMTLLMAGFYLVFIRSPLQSLLALLH